jgi:hypothetical protein
MNIFSHRIVTKENIGAVKEVIAILCSLLIVHKMNTYRAELESCWTDLGESLCGSYVIAV